MCLVHCGSQWQRQRQCQWPGSDCSAGPEGRVPQWSRRGLEAPGKAPCLGSHGRNNCLVTEPPIVHFFSLLCRLGGVALDVLLKQAMPSLLLGSVTCESGLAILSGRPTPIRPELCDSPTNSPPSNGRPAAGQTVKHRALIGPWKHESIVIDAPHLAAATSRVLPIPRRRRRRQHHAGPTRILSHNGPSPTALPGERQC